MQFILLCIGTITSIFCCYLYIVYSEKYNEIISGLNKKEYFISDLFFIGFGLMEMMCFSIKKSSSVKKIKKIAEVKGQVYKEFYYYVMSGAKFTYFIVFIPIACFVGAVFNKFSLTFLVLVFMAIIIYYVDFQIDVDVEKRREYILEEFPNVLSNLVLMVNAGMTLRSAWNYVSNNNEGLIYEEMKNVNKAVENGESEIQSLKNFSERCGLKEIRKFITVLIQNIEKGSAESVSILRGIADENWQQKKFRIKMKGEVANQKLIIPVGIMLIAILMMIVVPIFNNL